MGVPTRRGYLVAAISISAADVDFQRDVRPILSGICFKCHGPDNEARKANLRLDVRELAIEREAFVPGKPDQSKLVERIFTADTDFPCRSAISSTEHSST